MSIDSARASFSRSHSIKSAMRNRMRDRSAAGVARPLDERFLRGRHRKIDIARIAVGDLRVRLSRRRFDVVEIFSADRLNELTIDEITDLEWFGAHCVEIASAECIALNDRTARDASV